MLAVLWPYTDWSYLFGDRGIEQTLRVDKELRILSKEKTTKNLKTLTMDQVLINVVYTNALVIGCVLRQVRLFVTT